MTDYTFTGPMDWARAQVGTLRRRVGRRGGGRGLGGFTPYPDYEVVPETPSAPPPAGMGAGAVAASPALPSAAPAGNGQLEQAQADYLRNQMAMDTENQDREDAVAEGSLGLTGLDDQKALLQEDLADAQRLRDTPMQDLRQAGRVVVAANPLEALATAASRIKGNKQRKEVLGKIEGVNAQRKSGIDAIIGALRRRKRPMDEEIPSGLPGASS